MNVISSLIRVLLLGHYIILDVAAEIELSYEDLMVINAACRPRDTCSEARYGDGIFSDFSCSCSSRCSKLGNCCIDSDDKDTFSPNLKPSCRSVDGRRRTEGYYMVDKCAPGDKTRWKKLCEEDWNGENSIIPLAPVTSLFSSMTYKNYFCLRCHETTDEFRFWYAALTGNSELLQNKNVSNQTNTNSYILMYDRDLNTWLAEGKSGQSVPFPVKLGFEIPNYIASLVDKCDPNIISICSNSWRHDVTREKCAVYTALVYIDKNGKELTYKNPHCALCNFESLEKMECEPNKAGIFDEGRKTLTFSTLVSLNIHSGDKAEKISECPKNFKTCRDREVPGRIVWSKMNEDLLNINLQEYAEERSKPKCEVNSVWDPYGKKCRKRYCPIPGYVMKNGRCSRS